jgi:hypothetical protein
MATGSETTWAPAGTTTDVSPLKVSARELFGTIPETPARPSAGNATAAAVIGRSVVPNAFEKRTRISRPPIEVCTVCRTVVSASTESAPVNGAGGRFPGSVSCGIAVQVCTQLVREEAASATPDGTRPAVAAPAEPASRARRFMIRTSGWSVGRDSCT